MTRSWSETNEEIKLAVQRLRSVAEGLEIAYSHLPKNEWPGPPTTAVASLRKIADDLEKLVDQQPEEGKL
jgi:hypothetical protein